MLERGFFFTDSSLGSFFHGSDQTQCYEGVLWDGMGWDGILWDVMGRYLHGLYSIFWWDMENITTEINN